MFVQKIKASFRFLGILFLRVLIGIVAGYLWMMGLTFISRITVYRLAEHYMDGRYDALRDTVHGIIYPMGWYGAWVLIGIAIIWGFSQGGLDIRRWLRKQHA